MRGKKLHRHIVGGLAFVDGVVLHTSDVVVMAMRERSGEIKTRIWPIPERENAPYLAKFFIIRGLWLLWRTITLNSWLRHFIDENAGELKGHNDILAHKPLDEAEPRSVSLSLVPTLGLLLAFLGYMEVLFVFALSTHLKSGTVVEIKSDLLLITLLAVILFWVFRVSRFWDYMGYHGAQHQAIHAYEEGRLEAEDIFDSWPYQWRCGAAVVSYVAVFLVGLGYVLPDIFFIESVVVALILFSLSYELVLFIDKHSDRFWIKILSTPGVLLQLLIARHPSFEQSQVAHVAMKELATQSETLQKHQKREDEGMLT